MKRFSRGMVASLSLFCMSQFASANTLNFPALDVQTLHDKEIQREKKGEAPHFAVTRTVAVNPFNEKANWEKQGNYQVWSQRVVAQNAVSLNFAFETFHLSPNAKLEIFAADMSDVLETIDSSANNYAREYWSAIVMSDDVIIQLSVPSEEMHLNQLELTRVNQGFRTFSQKTEKAGSCNVDVVCSEGDDWRDEINSVAVISTGGRTFCTGFMVNNTANDKKPLFMTANHCGISRSKAPSLVAYWNYQSSRCGAQRGGSKKQYSSGSKFLAADSRSDFTIVLFNNSPKPEWEVKYAGWDRTRIEATSAVAIHHPSTDEKSISFENDPVTFTMYSKPNAVSNGTHVRVEDWDLGTTEPGSSGSPLFNQDHRVIGQLHGGYASCRSQTADWYGALNVSWEGGGSKSSRLKDHLDPIGTGDEVVDTI